MGGSHLEKLLEKEEGVGVEATVAKAFREKLLLPPMEACTYRDGNMNQYRKKLT